MPFQVKVLYNSALMFAKLFIPMLKLYVWMLYGIQFVNLHAHNIGPLHVSDNT